jgi:hypothetical protein
MSDESSQATTATEGVDLELVCDDCRGEGGWWTEGDFCRCLRCGGAGYRPTPLGEKVLSLVRHNFKPMMEDAKS